MAKAELDATKLPAGSIDAQLLAHLPAEARVQMLHFLKRRRIDNLLSTRNTPFRRVMVGLERRGIRP